VDCRRRRLTALFVLHILLTFRVIAMPWHLGDAVGDVVDHIDAGNALLFEQEHGLAFLFAEDRHQHVGASHFALAGALHVENSTLQHTLEAQGWLGFAVLVVTGISGVVESMNSCRSCLSLSRLAPQARRTVAAASLSKVPAAGVRRS
jgi:hypothetical protein